MHSISTVTVHDLGQLESGELQEMIGEQAQLTETHRLDAFRQGDAATLNLIASATPWVIGVIGMWILKPRKGKTVRQKISRTDEAGRTYEVEVYLHQYQEDSPKTVVVNALAKLFGLRAEVVGQAIDDAASKVR